MSRSLRQWGGKMWMLGRVLAVVLYVVLRVCWAGALSAQTEDPGVEYVIIGPNFLRHGCYMTYHDVARLDNTAHKSYEKVIYNSLTAYCSLYIQLSEYAERSAINGRKISVSTYWSFMAVDGEGLRKLGCHGGQNFPHTAQLFVTNVCKRATELYESKRQEDVYRAKIHDSSIAFLVHAALMGSIETELLPKQSERKRILEGDDHKFDEFQYLARFKEKTYKKKVIIPIMEFNAYDITINSQQLASHYLIGHVDNLNEIEKYPENMRSEPDTAMKAYNCTKLGSELTWRAVTFKENEPKPYTIKHNRQIILGMSTIYLSSIETLMEALNSTNSILIPLQNGCSEIYCIGAKRQEKYAEISASDPILATINPKRYVHNKEKNTVSFPEIENVMLFNSVFGIQVDIDDMEYRSGYAQGNNTFASGIDAIYNVKSLIGEARLAGKTIIPVCANWDSNNLIDGVKNFINKVDSIVSSIPVASSDKTKPAVRTSNRPPIYENVAPSFATKTTVAYFMDNDNIPTDVQGLLIMIKGTYNDKYGLSEAVPHLAEFINLMENHFYMLLNSIISNWSSGNTIDEHKIVPPDFLYYRHVLIIPNELLSSINTIYPFYGSAKCESFGLVLTASLSRTTRVKGGVHELKYIPSAHFIEDVCSTKYGDHLGDLMVNCEPIHNNLSLFGVVTDYKKLVHVDVTSLNKRDVDQLRDHIAGTRKSVIQTKEVSTFELPNALSELDCNGKITYRDINKLSISVFYQKLRNHEPMTVTNTMLRRSKLANEILREAGLRYTFTKLYHKHALHSISNTMKMKNVQA